VVEEVVVNYHIFGDHVGEPGTVVAVHHGVVVVKHDQQRVGDHVHHASGDVRRRIPG
jgi:hypothetical protein